ncbi:hypothetical protein BCR36DRAFT_350382 [Piromyces finnis]|uniref:Ima1 N-terminal domain-containing protein n=1 Tax=Piromyces finnis TaxID=1754191 RepID=A0A1Y1VBV5_9FUNG|nr:hypothetical protein BCR36DRAFT_350382 [Piromyces finnis]|eukprot:ORX52141.1 hypothetical protein BCR36DRAFT_350382 [Piromyces finnis]
MNVDNVIINSFQEYITKISPLLYDIINEVVHNTFFLFSITTIISLIIVYRIYNFIVELLPIKVTCFYCNCDSEFTKPPKDQRIKEKWVNNKPRYWWCRRCDNWNYVNENGEIQDISEFENIMENNANQANIKYCEKENVTINDYFCDTCKMHQEYIRQRLADYLPDEDDSEYEKYLDNLPQFKAHLERKYPIVCAECSKRVSKELENNQYKYRDLKLLLENRKKNQSFYKSIEESFITISPVKQTLSTIREKLKMCIMIIGISICFILGIIGTFWLSILLLKCFLEPEAYRNNMRSLPELLQSTISDILSYDIPFNQYFILFAFSKINSIDWNCAKLWSNTDNKLDNIEEDDLMKEYLNLKINEHTQNECPRQLWNYWFILCVCLSCIFIFFSFIEYIKNEIMLKPIFKKTTNKEFLWPVYLIISLNGLYLIWYKASSSGVTLFKYISLLYLILFLKVIWDFSIQTYIFISNTLHKPTPIVELKRTHSTIPGVAKTYELLTKNNKYIYNNDFDYSKTNSEHLTNKEDETTSVNNEIDDEFSVQLERQFKRSFSITTPHKNNNKYRDNNKKSKQKSNRNSHFSIKPSIVDKNYYYDDEDSDHCTIPDSSFDINDDSIFKEEKEENGKNIKSFEDSPTKGHSNSLFNTKSNTNGSASLFLNRPLSSLPNYTYISTKNKTGFFSQYNTNSLNTSFSNRNKKEGLWAKKDNNNDLMDTDKNISNMNNYRSHESNTLIKEDLSKSNPVPFLFGNKKNLGGGEVPKLTKLTSYISSNNNNSDNNVFNNDIHNNKPVGNIFNYSNKLNGLHHANNSFNHNFSDSDDENLLIKQSLNNKKTDTSDQLTEIMQKSQKFFLPEESTGLEDILSSIQVSSPHKSSWKNFIHKSSSNKYSLPNDKKKHNTLLQLERNKEIYEKQYTELTQLIKIGCYLNIIHLLIIHSILLLLDFFMDSSIKKSLDSFQFFLYNRLYYLQVKNSVDFVIQLGRIGISIWSAYIVLKGIWKFSKFEQILYLEKRYWIRKLEQKKNNKTFGVALQNFTPYTNVDSNSSLLYNQYKPKIRSKIRRLLLTLAASNTIYVVLIQPILLLHIIYYLSENLNQLNLVSHTISHKLKLINNNIYQNMTKYGFDQNELLPKLNLIYIINLQFLPMILSVLIIFIVDHWINSVHTKKD